MKRILVTGASKGIGRAAALKLAEDGFDVAVHYGRDKEGAEAVLAAIKEMGGRGSLICFNVADTAECKAVLEAFVEKNGAFYGIVSNAGITRDGPFPGMTEEAWFDVINTDLNSFYNVINPLIMPMIHLKQGGRIVSVSSVAGLTGNRGQVNYSAAKAGLIGAVKALSLELAKRKITVNCVAPGLIDTQMAEDIDPVVMDRVIDQIPLRRMGKAEEVAALVSFLCSDAASYITRQVISVNGGLV